ncbi:MAG: hypothetical protein D6715_12330, partial [Calditrichaeota bacterium]
MEHRRTLLWLSIYAIAMAFLEAAVVVYLRQLYYPENPLVIFPPRFMNQLDLAVELGREASTVAMMLAVAFLAVRKNPTRIFAAFVYQFGVWDLFYYLWLKVCIGWPVSWTEWDVLFLIPWVWLGPWICPALIALLFGLWGGRVLLQNGEVYLRRRGLWLFVLGSLLGLVSFLQPAVPVLLREGVEGFARFEPGGFWWGAYLPGLLLMAVGLFSGTAVRLPRLEG